MKKLLGIFVCILMLTGLTLTVLSAASAELTIETAEPTVRPGDTLNFSVKLSGVERSRSAAIQLSYDQSVFEFLEGKCVLTGTVLASFQDRTGVFTYGGDTNISGEIFTFSLKVKSDAAPGAYEIGAIGNVRDSNGAIPTTVNKPVIYIVDDTGATETTNPVDETTAPTQAPTVPTEATKPAENVKPTENVTTTETTKPVSGTTAPTEETAPTNETTVSTEATQSLREETTPTEQTVPETTEKTEVVIDDTPESSLPRWLLTVCVAVILGIIGLVVKQKKQDN